MNGPGILIASPQMRDMNFSETIILLWHYSEQGAMGVVLNRGLNVTVGDVLERLELDPGDAAAALHDRVLLGGPVENDRGYLLFRGDVPEDEGWNLPGGIAVSTSLSRLETVMTGGGDYLLCLGYSGWSPGQLDKEIETGSWLYTEIDDGLVFDHPLQERYRNALATLGLTPELVWMTPVDE